MVFNSLTFLVFFVVVLAVDRLLSSWTARKTHLLLVSYAFYAAWNPPLVALLWLSTVVDWFAARGMHAAQSQRVRRAFLGLSLLGNLGLLGYFKYADFLLDNFTALASALGFQYQAPELGIVLPVGISFYTFQTLSYTLDVYLRRAKPWTSPLDFALYVTFFPQLVAGPIVRASEFHAQLQAPRRASAAQFGFGLALLLFGLVEKVTLADGVFAPFVDQVYDKAARAGSAEAWFGTMAFSAQIFFDFAGYSTCAIGVALCLGFHLPDNFRCPYASIGFSEFWRRWHISLSSWLRDYLYIPLGGNRRGPTRTYVNLMLTMLLGGLWHGSTWMFVIWGGLHGVYLAIERLVQASRSAESRPNTLPRALAGMLCTYALTCVTWVFFRAGDMATAKRLVSSMFIPRAGGGLLERSDYATLGVAITVFLAAQWSARNTPLDHLWSRCPAMLRVVTLALMLVLLCLSGGDNRAFIYFQF